MLNKIYNKKAQIMDPKKEHTLAQVFIKFKYLFD